MEDRLENKTTVINAEVFLDKVKECANGIVARDYALSQELSRFSNEKLYSKRISETAEALARMALKLEGRELALEEKVRELEDSIQKRKDFTFVFVSMILVVTSYVFLVFITEAINFPEIMSRFVEVSVLTASILWIKRTKLPLSEFGLTFNGAGKSIRESILVASRSGVRVASILDPGAAAHATIQ